MKFHKIQQSKFGLPVTATGCTHQTKNILYIYKAYSFHSMLYIYTAINSLDINFCLNSESYQPYNIYIYIYKKPNDEPLYINRNSNHPPTILSWLPQTISKRKSSLSSNFELFSRAAPIYNAALENAGYTERVKYDSEINVSKPPRNRKRNIIWYNPPYNKSVSTNIGHVFLNLLDKHFHRAQIKQNLQPKQRQSKLELH